MAAVMTRHEVGVCDVGSAVRVPNNAIAKLMFYTKCICDLINLYDMDEIFKRLTDFERYYLLTELEIDKLIIFCMNYSPEVLADKCLFHNEDICGDSINKFIELSSVDRQLIVSDDIMLGGTQTRVKRIMCYKMEWLMEYYLAPMLIMKRRHDKIMKIIAMHNREVANADCCCTIL